MCGCQVAYRARRQRLDGIDAAMVQSKLTKLEQEGQTHLEAMCPAYALTLLQNATVRQPHQDTLFFEALYKVRHIPVLLQYLWECIYGRNTYEIDKQMQMTLLAARLLCSCFEDFSLLPQVLVDMIAETFPQRPRSDIEGHVGELFRTSFFNVPKHT